MYGAFYYGGGNYGGGGGDNVITRVRKAINKIVMLTRNKWSVLTSRNTRTVLKADVNKTII